MIRRPPRSTRTDTRLPYTTLFRSPAVDKAVEQNASGDTLDASEVVELRGYSEDEEPAHADESHDDEGHDDEGAAHADESHDGHDHGEDDPHFWLDPLKMAGFSDEIAKTLAEIDPDHEADFAANAEIGRAHV